MKVMQVAMRWALFMCLVPFSTGNDNEDDAIAFLEGYNKDLGTVLNQYTVASWNYETNITEFNSNQTLEAQAQMSAFAAEAFVNASQFDTEDFSADTKRQLKQVGSRALPEDEEAELAQIVSQMGDIYGSAKVCVSDSECYNLEPGLTEIMAKSTNYTLRRFVWEEWRREVGQKLKPLYERYVELKNKRAVLNNYTDYGDQWRQKYETTTFEDQVLGLYTELEPLYKELHAYVRRKLYNVYGEEYIDLRGKLPANVLSDMWGRFWNNLYSITVPFPDRPSIDPSEALEQQGYDVLKLFETGNSFYTGMGMLPVPDSFWELSMLEKPTDRDVICHATAWDFYDGKDFRIRMCTRNFSYEDYNTIHHELGHIQYQQQYSDLPMVYRDGANDGFHEAIGELMGMCASTPKHLYSIGLLDELIEDEEIDLNFLLSQALITISTLPFHLVNDLWRWKVFRGEFPIEDWNDEFWKLKESIVGVEAPVERTQLDLDPPALYHICQDYDMIRYFVRTIIQFQFNEKMCELSGHEGPLHRCDFSSSAEAGEALAKMLRLGMSLPWQDTMEVFLGTREMSTRAIRSYFDPLYVWLQKTNQQNGDVVGWE